MIDFIELCLLAIILIRIENLHTKGKTIMATQKQAAEQLTQANESLRKIGTETQTLLEKIIALEAAVSSNGDGEVSPELQAAIDGVVDQAQKIDDLVPDATGNLPPTNPTQPTEDQLAE